MIDRKELLKDLQRMLRMQLEPDLRERCKVPEIGAAVKAEYEKAKKAKRTAQSFEDWRTDYITQIGAAWILSCVFARFLEDNQLVDPPKLSGPTGAVSGQQSAVSQTEADSRSLNADSYSRLQRARDEYDLYVQHHPAGAAREYLLFVFDGLAELPGGKDIFGKHNLVHEQRGWISGDAAKELRNFWQRIDPASGKLIHDFTDPKWDTRFLGDLYQDLSEAARKKYALLQTPEFVEEFILDRTLEPALDEFGVDAPAIQAHYDQPATPAGFRMIDPACGSGHFLLGAFHHILDRWQKKEPGTNVRELVLRTLKSVNGVDLNPFAVAISRFRLLLAAMKACGVLQLEMPFDIRVACGDALLHGPDTAVQKKLVEDDDTQHAYWIEDLPLLRQILRNRHFHCVVANPPYITPKDSAAGKAYRRLYLSCHRQYSLAVPFMERIFRLAVRGRETGEGAGYTGQITANSFMKREFGKKLIEEFFPSVDLTHVIDTSGAYIPGHGTPTVILLGKNRQPMTSTIRTVMGIEGEPSTPSDPSRGSVWSAIVTLVDEAGSQSEFVSVADSQRKLFQKHPWAMGGGGAAELRSAIENATKRRLKSLVQAIGRTTVAGEDEAWIVDNEATARRYRVGDTTADLVLGDHVRDWLVLDVNPIVYPYKTLGGAICRELPEGAIRFLWPNRALLSQRTMFGRTVQEATGVWFPHLEHYGARLRAHYSITFSEIATHNHFALSVGERLFNKSAPVITLGASCEETAFAILGILNSSTSCSWLKQVCHNKGSTVDQHGARQRTSPFEDFFAFNATKVKQFPVPEPLEEDIPRRINCLASELSQNTPNTCLVNRSNREQLVDRLADAKNSTSRVLGKMICLQEDLDWQCYKLYGLVDEGLTYKAATFPIQLGQRAFEIVLARKVDRGVVQTTWFERHGSTPITEIPADWPDDYKQLVERRIEVIESNPQIALIEQPEYKRRWNTESWDSQVERALRSWLLDRLESYFDFDGRMSRLDPEGISAISRGLSAATPPVTDAPTRTDPGGVTAPGAATPLGSNGMARDPYPGCAARPGANGLNPSGIKPLDIALVSAAELADIAARDAEFMEVAALYRDRPDFDVARLVADLVEGESVPLLPVLRYKPEAMDKRQAWERTWELQREEDREAETRREREGEKGRQADDSSPPLPLSPPPPLSTSPSPPLNIPVPPKYKSSDFQSSVYWRLRGKLDVPKERWVSFPHCEGEDQSLVIAWAGYDHLQLTKAVSAFFAEVQQTGGSEDPRLVPLLGCILELNPWVKQWHNDVDPDFGYRLGDYFANFVEDEARTLGKTVDDIRGWQPPAMKSQKKKRTKKS